MSNKTTLQFFMDNIIDNENGGVFTSVDANGKNLICNDKRLVDQALAILALSEYNNKANMKEYMNKCLYGLEKLKDDEHPGYIEFTDKYWTPHLPGYVRTLSSQLLAVLALLEYGSLIEDKKILTEGFNLLETFMNIPLENGLPHIVSRDWKKVIDDKRDIKTLSIAILVLDKANLIEPKQKYSNYLNALVQQLELFIDTSHGGVHEIISAQGNPILTHGKNCNSMSLTAFALAKISKSLKNPLLLKYANNILEFIDKNLKHSIYGGFWNHCTTDGIVTADPINSYYNSNCPFPAVFSSDQALVFLSALEVYKINKTENLNKLVGFSINAIANFSDATVGGVFMGETSWFSSPTDPLVPLGRLFQAPRHTPGALHTGNTSYIPLQQKQTVAQALTLIAIHQSIKNNIEIPTSICNKTQNIKNMPLQDYSLTPDITSNLIKNVSRDDLKLNIERYLKWMSGARNLDGFGLTAELSPLGFRSDTSTQVFATHHALSDLLVLKENIKEKDAIIAHVRACQSIDGGFGEQFGHPCDVFTTYCGVLSLNMLESEPTDPKKCIEYLQSCQNPDGGFGIAPGYRSDLWHTNLAVASLNALKSKPTNIESCINFVLSCYNSDGSYSIIPCIFGDTYSCYRAISTLMLLDKRPVDCTKTIEWLKNCQTSNGGFMYKPNSPETFVGTYHAIAALYLLGESPNNIEKCKEWFAEHQALDGGVSRVIGAVSDTTDEGFTALQSSFILEKSLSPYWVAMIN